jgi:hypothetical protein
VGEKNIHTLYGADNEEIASCAFATLSNKSYLDVVFKKDDLNPLNCYKFYTYTDPWIGPLYKRVMYINISA